MKKTALIALLLITTALLIGCTNSEPTEETQQITPNSQEKLAQPESEGAAPITIQVLEPEGGEQIE